MAATATSLAATGLSAFGKISAGNTASSNAITQANNALQQGQATNSADQFRAQTLSNEAETGRIQETQVDADMRMALSNRLANVAVTQAAANTDPNSPTNAAILARTEAVGDMNRQQRVGNIEAQVQQDQTGSVYYQQAGANALAASQVNAATLRGNAATDQTNGWLGALGAGLGGLAGLKFS